MATGAGGKTNKTTKPSYDELAAELARTQAKLAKVEATKVRPGGSIWRRSGIAVLIIAGCVTLAATSTSAWANRLINNDTYYSNVVSGLVQEPTVATAITQTVTNQIFAQVDVEQVAKDALPPQAAFLAAPLASQVKSRTSSLVHNIVVSDQFDKLWVSVNNTAHNKLLKDIKNGKSDGQIDISQTYQYLSSSLESTPLAFLAGKQLPAKIGAITIINASWIPEVRTGINAVSWARYLTLALTVALFGGAIAASLRRRRTLITVMLAGIVTLALSLLSVRVGSAAAVASIADPVNAAAAKTIIAAFTKPLIEQLWGSIAVALFIALVAWISGPARSAVAVKRGVARGTTYLNTNLIGDRNSAFLTGLTQYRRAVEGTLVGLTLLALLLLTPINVGMVVTAAIILVILILIVEFLTAAPSKESAA